MKKPNVIVTSHDILRASIRDFDNGVFIDEIYKTLKWYEFQHNKSLKSDGGGHDMNEALDLLKRLHYHIHTVHLDMGGKNRYSLDIKAHPIIDEIKEFLSRPHNKSLKSDAGHPVAERDE